MKILFFLLITSVSLVAQNIDFGLGMSTGYGKLFVNENVQENGNFSLLNNWSSVWGGGVYIDLSGSSYFDCRLAINANLKKIRVTINEFIAADRLNTEFVTYTFPSIDAKAIVRVNVSSTEDKWCVIPISGFSIGVSKFNLNKSDYAQRANYAPANWQNRVMSETIEDKSSFIYTALLAGMDVRPPFKLFRKIVEWNITFSYSPLSFLKEPIKLTPFLLEGNYHFVSTGINLSLQNLNK